MINKVIKFGILGYFEKAVKNSKAGIKSIS
jgi:hypothetical protein